MADQEIGPTDAAVGCWEMWVVGREGCGLGGCSGLGLRFVARASLGIRSEYAVVLARLVGMEHENRILVGHRNPPSAVIDEIDRALMRQFGIRILVDAVEGGHCAYRLVGPDPIASPSIASPSIASPPIASPPIHLSPSVSAPIVVVPATGHASVREVIESVVLQILQGPCALDDLPRQAAEAAVEALGVVEGCPVHAGVVHGMEAERLRAGIERILKEERNNEGIEEMIISLSRLLDEVDAGDSLAHQEQVDRATIGDTLGAVAGDASGGMPARGDENQGPELLEKVEDMSRALSAIGAALNLCLSEEVSADCWDVVNAVRSSLGVAASVAKRAVELEGALRDIGWAVNVLTEETASGLPSCDIGRVVSGVRSHLEGLGSLASRAAEFESGLRDIGDVVGLKLWGEDEEIDLDVRKVVAEVKTRFTALRSEIERLDRDGQVAWIASALAAATSSSSTARSREHLRGLLVAWAGGGLGGSAREIVAKMGADQSSESVDTLDLGVAASNFLLANRIRTIYDLTRLTKEDLLGLKHGKIRVKARVVEDVIAALSEVGLSLGVVIK
jgi:hypothetical protein